MAAKLEDNWGTAEGRFPSIPPSQGRPHLRCGWFIRGAWGGGGGERVPVEH